ncbi:MAG TPA: enoyl-CoA hydratase-related protein [Sandaracinaceae bacterium LLY-WYZ-13_1]|nr:enoyl-CoA hydratase-related protein [Sandaracinaceae bacterium LLY-WYZ-13_1]
MEARPYETIAVAVEDHVCTITLSIPERKNPIGPQMVNELLYAFDDAKADDDVRVVVLTGAGQAFSAGGDLKQMSGGGDGPKLEPKGDYADLLLRFTTLGKPTVARVNGVAMGGGLGLVASCDFALAAESAVLGTPEIKRGLFPMMIMAVLQRVMSRRRLLEMMLLGDKLTAAQAAELELVNRAVADDRLDAEVAALTEKLAGRSPTAMRMGLAAYHHQADRALADAVPYLQQQLFAILGTEDAREGLTAFLEKREPRWTGR